MASLALDRRCGPRPQIAGRGGHPIAQGPELEALGRVLDGRDRAVVTAREVLVEPLGLLGIEGTVEPF